MYLKQKESCKYYTVKVPGKDGGEKLPNIADIFDLWPYIMYYNRTKNENSDNG